MLEHDNGTLDVTAPGSLATRRRHHTTAWIVGGAAAVGLALITATTIDAHKGNTSKWTYNDDIYPLLRDKCGRCHVDGGAAPMSLLKYDIEDSGAVAWAESIREMLVTEAMPPWYADPTGPAVKNNHTLTPRELDMIVTWAVGATPRGDLNHPPPKSTVHVDWMLGKPDLELPMPEAHVVGPGVMEDDADLTIATNFTEAKWVKAVDLLPGSPEMVRRATISNDATGQILAAWEPGDDGAAAPVGTAFTLPAGAKLRLKVHYKKGWQDEQVSKSDRSTIGVYFTDEPMSGKSIQSFAVDGPKPEGNVTQPRTFTSTLSAGGRVLALRPSVDQPYASVVVDAVSASGRRVPLLKLRGIRPEWPRRYWLVDPVDLPAGTKIEVKVAPSNPEGGPLMAAVNAPLQIALDLVPE